MAKKSAEEARKSIMGSIDLSGVIKDRSEAPPPIQMVTPVPDTTTLTSSPNDERKSKLKNTRYADKEHYCQLNVRILETVKRIFQRAMHEKDFYKMTQDGLVELAMIEFLKTRGFLREEELQEIESLRSQLDEK